MGIYRCLWLCRKRCGTCLFGVQILDLSNASRPVGAIGVATSGPHGLGGIWARAVEINAAIMARFALASTDGPAPRGPEPRSAIALAGYASAVLPAGPGCQRATRLGGPLHETL
jgi:hypothetical protein